MLTKTDKALDSEKQQKSIIIIQKMHHKTLWSNWQFYLYCSFYFNIISSLFHCVSNPILHPKASLPELITACHIILGSVHSQACSMKTSTRSKNSCDKPIKMSDLPLARSLPPLQSDRALSCRPQGRNRSTGVQRAWRIRWQWHIADIRIAPKLSPDELFNFGRTVEPELLSLQATQQEINTRKPTRGLSGMMGLKG